MSNLAWIPASAVSCVSIVFDSSFWLAAFIRLSAVHSQRASAAKQVTAITSVQY